MADDERSAEVERWLEVEPLDDVTRRRLVSTALRERAPETVPSRPSYRWRWVAVAAAVVAVLVGTLVVVTANGGHDEQQATENGRAALSPKALATTPDLGDFGDLDDAANLAALRAALNQSSATSAAPQAAGDTATPKLGAGASANRETPMSRCGAVVPAGDKVEAQATGTIDGRRATVVLVESADGNRSFDAVIEDPCELRPLR